MLAMLLTLGGGAGTYPLNGLKEKANNGKQRENKSKQNGTAATPVAATPLLAAAAATPYISEGWKCMGGAR